MKEEKNSIYRFTQDETLLQFDTNSVTGLSSEEASKRLEQYGPNQLKEGKRTSFFKKLKSTKYLSVQSVKVTFIK